MLDRNMSRFLKIVDESVAVNGPRLSKEVLAYIGENEPSVADQLRRQSFATIPTSFGLIRLNLSDLAAVV